MKRILVVDDEIEITKIVREFLDQNGYETLVASNGEQALKIIDSDLKTDLLVLDRRMPGLDGMAVLKHLQNAKRIMPVIMITGSYNVEPLQNALKTMEFDDIRILLKPVDLFSLLDIIKEMLNKPPVSKLS